MIHHHPEDDLLLALAAGHVAGGAALVLAVHLETCALCRSRVHTLHAVGGVMLESVEPQLLAPDSLARTLECIEAPPAKPLAKSPRPKRPALPGGRVWPASLERRDIGPWRWMAPGMRFSRIAQPRQARGSLYLLQIAPGSRLASHTHTQLEFTQVLCGSFHDGRALFGPGDFDATDPRIHHQPVVAHDDVCVCLAYVEGHLDFDGRIAAAIGRLIGM